MRLDHQRVLLARDAQGRFTGAGTGGRSGSAHGRPCGSFDTHPLHALVHDPLETAPRAPQGVMPLAWAAPDAGFFGFRNNWSGGDDEIITHFYSHTGNGGAGTLRLVGLGQVWSHGLNPAAPVRFGENVVQLPEKVLNENARGLVRFQDSRPDGSGALTVDLGDLYTEPRIDDNDRAETLYEKYGAYRRPAGFVDQGVTGLRALAVDYSGASGAPCLIVLADSIRGGGRKVWTWQIESKQQAGPPTTRVKDDAKGDIVFDGKQFKYKIGQLLKRESRRIDDDPAVKVRDDGFTLTRGDAALHATFIAPAKPAIELAERVEYRQGFKSGVARTSSKAIFAEGGDDFLVVLTLQRGPAPAVSASGAGLAAKVKVGGQTVSFDGQKIVFGK